MMETTHHQHSKRERTESRIVEKNKYEESMKEELTDKEKLQMSIKKGFSDRYDLIYKIEQCLRRLDISNDKKTENGKRTREEMGSFENLEDLPDFKVEKRPKIDEDESTLRRNKRILQIGLFDHLKKAKDALEKEKNNKKIMLHNLQNQKIEEKIMEKRKRLDKMELKEIETEVHNYIKELRSVEKKN